MSIVRAHTYLAMPLLVFLALSLASAVLLWHRYVPRYSSASFGAAVTSTAVFQLLAFLDLGYLDPFVIIAVITSFTAAFVVALLVGLPIRGRRKQRQEPPDAL
jgi:NhaP-type Na+/H+ and K+/H+ antiporter